MSNEQENIRIVGYSVLGSALVFLIYDIVPFIVKNDFVTATEKILAFLIAILLGMLFIRAIPMIRNLSPLNYYVIIIVILVIGVILVGVLYVDFLKHITIKAEMSNYAGSESVTISGEVNPPQPNEKVLIQIFYPNGELYNSTKVSFIDDSNLYEYKLNMPSLGHGVTDVFTIKASYAGYEKSTSFEYTDNKYPSSTISP